MYSVRYSIFNPSRPYFHVVSFRLPAGCLQFSGLPGSPCCLLAC